MGYLYLFLNICIVAESKEGCQDDVKDVILSPQDWVDGS